MKIVYVNFVQIVSMLSILKFELFKKGYQTFNKHVEWWRINHSWGNVTVEPIIDVDSKTD